MDYKIKVITLEKEKIEENYLIKGFLNITTNIFLVKMENNINYQRKI